jgi:hypothetical protein
MNQSILSRLLLLTCLSFFATGCATIFTGSRSPLSVQTNPPGAKVLIRNKKGLEVFHGTTPADLKLRSGAGYFGRESYAITLSLEGFEPKTINIDSRINGWYFGNILLGGALGMLIIDPLTGAMYKLDTEKIDENLKEKSGANNRNEPSLQILTRSNIPDTWDKHLVRIE